MKTFLFIAMNALSVIFAAALLCGCSPPAESQPKTPAWQYLQLEATRSKTTNSWPAGGFYFPDLDELGRKGWDLVSTVPITESGHTESVVLVFKRPAGLVDQ